MFIIYWWLQSFLAQLNGAAQTQWILNHFITLTEGWSFPHNHTLRDSLYFDAFRLILESPAYIVFYAGETLLSSLLLCRSWNCTSTRLAWAGYVSLPLRRGAQWTSMPWITLKASEWVWSILVTWRMSHWAASRAALPFWRRSEACLGGIWACCSRDSRRLLRQNVKLTRLFGSFLAG